VTLSAPLTRAGRNLRASILIVTRRLFQRTNLRNLSGDSQPNAIGGAKKPASTQELFRIKADRLRRFDRLTAILLDRVRDFRSDIPVPRLAMGADAGRQVTVISVEVAFDHRRMPTKSRPALLLSCGREGGADLGAPARRQVGACAAAAATMLERRNRAAAGTRSRRVRTRRSDQDDCACRPFFTFTRGGSAESPRAP